MGYAKGTHVVITPAAPNATPGSKPPIYTVLLGPNKKGVYLLEHPDGSWTTRLSECIAPYTPPAPRYTIELRPPKAGERVFVYSNTYKQYTTAEAWSRDGRGDALVIVEGPL